MDIALRTTTSSEMIPQLNVAPEIRIIYGNARLHAKYSPPSKSHTNPTMSLAQHVSTQYLVQMQWNQEISLQPGVAPQDNDGSTNPQGVQC